MKTPNFFEQIASGLAKPEAMSQWLKATMPIAPIAPDDVDPAKPAKAWTESVDALLKNAEALRHMQLDAIHEAQKQAAQLAKSLGESKDPLHTVQALQQFSQENVQSALRYWTAYRDIVQNAEVQMLGTAEKSLGKRHGYSGKSKEPAAATPSKNTRKPKGRSPRA